MGIKHLNRVFNQKCNDRAIYKIHLKQLSGEKIAVDASIYLYRFLGDEKLAEQIYLMASIFRKYNIAPVFVFDGAAPPEKKDVLNERKEGKRKAEERYLQMKANIETNALELDEKYEAELEMEQLKKQFIYIKDADIKHVKQLLDVCGISWVVARGEADEHCAHLIHTGQVYACLSEDMDMFAYGCCRILRHFSMVKHSVLMYDLPEILRQLGLNLREFRQILVLSGTDYNKDDAASLFEVLKWFDAYKADTLMMEEDVAFYDWVKGIQSEQARKIYKMFVLTDKVVVARSANYDGTIKNRDIDRNQLIKVLAKDGFIFA
jgi:5'-3' exonuclease